MSTIVSTIRDIVRLELQSLRLTELGVVKEIYPHAKSDDSDNYGCDVTLKNSGLVLTRVPIATGHIGSVAIPNVGDLVFVSYVQGDIHQPIVTGRLYNDEDRPPLSNANELIFRLPLNAADDKTIKADIRNLPAESPPREILVEMPPKISVQVTDGTVRAVAGKTELTLDQPGATGGTVTVLAGRTKITMNQDGDVSVESAGAMEIKATRDLDISAVNVSITAQANLSLEAGASAKVKANAQLTMQAAGAATVQAATVMVKGVTSFGP
jgi:phage baseplate assembly protein gpV